MWTEIDRYAQSCHMFDQAEYIVMGLSGGADSVCLARYLLHLRSRGGPALCAVHVNHLLRGDEAERDEAFVKDLCEKWDIPLSVIRRDVRLESRKRREGIEETGRRVRYACFSAAADQIAEKTGRRDGIRIAVAHHADDLAETMLFRMIRGTGPGGLAGIRPVNGDVIRPLLGMTREKIIRILRKLGQDYVSDSTNQDTEYSRNFIRHHILADMRKLNPRVVEHLSSLAVQLADLSDYAKEEMDGLCGEILHDGQEGPWVRVCDLEALGSYARQEAARRLLFMAAGKEKDIGQVHVKELLMLSGSRDGKRNAFPYGITAIRRGEKLILVRGHHEDPLPSGEQTGSFDQVIPLPAFSEGKEWEVPAGNDRVLSLRYLPYAGQHIPKNDCIKWFDYDRIKDEIHLRNRRAGDYFLFDSMGRTKRLSRYFIDNKVPGEERDRQLVLAENSHILWILEGRISEYYKVTKATRRLLVVSLQERGKEG